MSTLTIPLKSIYFDQIKVGTKTQEFRLVTPFWARRIRFKHFDFITFTKGYPAQDDAERRLTFPWRGYEVKVIQHEHFGPDPVEVFAINIGAES